MSIIQSEKIKEVTVVKFDDSIKKFNALVTEEGKKELTDFFTKPNTKLVLNMAGINYVDSSGFGVFLSVMKRANNNYGIFKICNIAPDVMELFKLLQLHNIFEIYENLDDCIKSFN